MGASRHSLSPSSARGEEKKKKKKKNAPAQAIAARRSTERGGNKWGFLLAFLESPRVCPDKEWIDRLSFELVPF